MLTNILEYLSDKWWACVRYPLKRALHIVGCIYGYTKDVFYNDYDFDYACLLRLMQYKIKRIRLCMTKNDHLLHTGRYVRQMLIAENIIERILDDDYASSMYKAHNTKWGLDKMEFFDRLNRVHLNAEAKEQESLEFRAYADESARLREKDWNFLFEHMRKRMRHWWD